jgi:thioredoxin reductase
MRLPEWLSLLKTVIEEASYEEAGQEAQATLSILPLSSTRLRQFEYHPKVTPLFGWELQRILGGDCVTGVEIATDYATRQLTADGVFVELGLIPNIEFIRGLVEFDPETGHIPVNQRCETALPGLFAAGDVTDVYAEQITVAIGEGVKAAISAWEYLVTR